jgi:GDPmannose 4,6-dehydratase
MAVNYRKAYGLFVSCGTLFNHESERRGLEFVTRKITAAAARISVGLQDKLVLGDLSPRRDWGFAGDYTRAMQAMLKSSEPDDFVVASGQDYSVEEFVTASFNMLNLNWQDYVISDPQFYRKNELPCLTGDPRHARAKLGWKPKLSFEGLVERMVLADVERAEAEKRYGIHFQ